YVLGGSRQSGGKRAGPTIYELHARGEGRSPRAIPRLVAAGYGGQAAAGSGSRSRCPRAGPGGPVGPVRAAAGAGPGRIRPARIATSGLSAGGRLVRLLPGTGGSAGFAGGRPAGGALAALPGAGWCWRDAGAF